MTRLQQRSDSRPGFVFALIFVALATGIVIAGYFYYRNQQRQFRTEANHQISAIAELKAGELVQWRKERLANGNILFKNASFSALVRRFLEKPEDTDAQHELQIWLGKYVIRLNYSRVSLLDAQGAERLAVPAKPEPVCGYLSQNLAAVQRSGQVAFMDLHRDAPGHPIHLAVLVPILDEADGSRLLGTIVLRIDPARYLFPFIQHWPTLSRTAETLLLRRDGNDILYLNELRHQKNTAFALRIPLTRTDVPAVKAAMGQTGIVPGVDYRGVPVLAATQAVSGSPWFIIAKIDLAEVNAPLHEQLWQVVGMIVVLLFGAGTAVALVWRQQHVRSYQKQWKAKQKVRDAEEGLRASEAQLRFVTDHAPVRIAQCDHERRYRFVNRPYAEMFEKRPADIVGKHAREVLGEETYGHAGPYMETALAGQPVEYDLVLPATSGKPGVVHVSYAPERDGSGRVVGFIAVILDITERKQAEQALIQSRRAALNMMTDAVAARDQAVQLGKELTKHHDHLEQLVAERTAQLQAANKELEAFSYSVSHDLRAPLRAIDGFSRIISEEYAPRLDDEARRLLDVIHSNIAKMGRLIDDLLAFSRLSRQRMAAAPVNLSAMANVVFTELKSQEKDRRIEFSVGALPAAHGDHAMLQQVLQNLLANAVKFTRTRKAARIELGGRSGNTENTFFVRDNGVGFDMAYADKLFGVFHRLHGTDEFEGTGVGLAIVQRIVLRHGGRVWAESKGGKGATFFFSLPSSEGTGDEGKGTGNRVQGTENEPIQGTGDRVQGTGKREHALIKKRRKNERT